MASLPHRPPDCWLENGEDSLEMLHKREREDTMDILFGEKELTKIKSMPLRVTLIYFVIGSIWVLLFSDMVLQNFIPDARTRARVEVGTGCFYLIVTAGIFFLLLRNRVDKFLKSAATRSIRQW